MILKSWSRKTGRGVADLKGINVTKSAVEFWFETPDNVTGRVSLHQFHVERNIWRAGLASSRQQR